MKDTIEACSREGVIAGEIRCPFDVMTIVPGAAVKLLNDAYCSRWAAPVRLRTGARPTIDTESQCCRGGAR